MKRYSFFLLLLAICLNVQAQQLELVAMRTDNISTLLHDDSAWFKHSGFRNSKITTALSPNIATDINYHYDTAYQFLYQFSSTVPYWQMTKTYDMNNRIAEGVYSKLDISSNWYPVYKYTYGYLNGTSMLDSISEENYETTSSTYKPYRITYYEYDVTNTKAVEKRLEEWDAVNSVWEKLHIDSTWYNGQGRVARYGTGGNLDHDTVVHYNYLHHYSYDGNGIMIKDSILVNNNTLQYTDYSYDVNGRLVTQELFFFDMGNWRPGKKSIYLYDANSNITNIYDSSWVVADGKYKMNFDHVYTYSASNQITKYAQNRWDNGVFVNVSNKYYYYGGIVPDNVKGIERDDISMKIYPIPATSFVNLEIKLKQAQAVTINLLNMQGQLVKQEVLSAAKAFNKQILLPDLAQGTYSLQVQTPKGSITKQLVIMQ